MNRKEKFAGAVIGVSTQFADLRRQLKELQDAYMDRGYQSGGAHEIIDADLISFDITASQLSIMIYSFAIRLDELMSGNELTSVIDGDAVINAIRNDF